MQSRSGQLEVRIIEEAVSLRLFGHTVSLLTLYMGVNMRKKGEHNECRTDTKIRR